MATIDIVSETWRKVGGGTIRRNEENGDEKASVGELATLCSTRVVGNGNCPRAVVDDVISDDEPEDGDSSGGEEGGA